jgi:hypothetical protein
MLENNFEKYTISTKEKYSELYGIECIHPNQSELEDLINNAKEKQKMSPEYKLETFFS